MSISQTAVLIDFLSANPPPQCNANVGRKNITVIHYTCKAILSAVQQQEHGVLDPTKLQPHNMDQSWRSWCSGLGSLKSLVVLNFELEFRSEGVRGLDLKDGVVPARETYMGNVKLVVDVVACCNCSCKKKESRCCHSSLTELTFTCSCVQADSVWTAPLTHVMLCA